MDPQLWNLERRNGVLHMDGHSLVDLSRQYGTPLHVVSARQLRARCAELKDAFANYPGSTAFYFSYKTSLVSGVLSELHRNGIGAEVVDGYELWLARRLGVRADDIVFNGPNKSDDELRSAIEAGVGLLVVDGLDELRRLGRLSAQLGRTTRIALRVCPDVAPKGMNVSAVTGSRRNHFGMDIGSRELGSAIREAVASPHLRLRGVHAHIGSGIHDMGAFRVAAERVLRVHAETVEAGAEPDVIDLGGGLGTRLSREFSTWELLMYLAFGRLPRFQPVPDQGLVRRYAQALCHAVETGCSKLGLRVPRLLLEPGRALVSDAQVLLLSVGTVRSRSGVGRFAMTDGGAMTVSMMFLSELHHVFLCNRDAPNNGVTSVFGKLPSPMDVVYRNLSIPDLERGDILAIMDAGAYFTSTSTNFGGPRPAVAMLDEHGCRIVRRRESYDDLARAEVDLERALS